VPFSWQHVLLNSPTVSDPTANPSGWWPAGTNDSYIYEGDIWIGAKKNGKIGVSEADGRSSEIWPTDDVPEIVLTKPGVTTNGKATSQSAYLKCTDMNTEVNDNPLGLEIECNGYQWSYAPLYDFFILEYNTISELKCDIRMCVVFLAKYTINSLYQVWV
jgi:hypothetical protein